MQYIFLSFVAGILTVLSPCVFTLLPVILGGSLESTKIKRPITIILSLMSSIFLFTLILKASSVLIGVPQQTWNIISGGILIIFGLITLFPEVWGKFSLKIGFITKSNKWFDKSTKREGLLGDIFVGAALGPVFSSCSPTYAIILATVLPVNLAAGVIDLLFYVAGLGLVLLLISYFGQKLIKRFKWAVNPKGWFKRIIGVVFLIIGLAIITGFDKQFETYLLDNGYFDVTKIEINALNSNNSSSANSNSVAKEVTLNVAKPYPAPDFKNIENWINSQPLSIKDLKGKVVLIDFWTYSCINCLRTLPYLKDWYTKYKDQGLVVIGVHSPEFSFEKVKENVETFVKDNQITYPVAQDNNFGTWTNYQNQYWPAEYFIDKNGNVVNTHFGEGEYDMSENVIRKLLGLDADANAKTSEVPVSQNQTPETYLGYDRGQSFQNGTEFLPDLNAEYKLSESVSPDFWTIGGLWKITKEEIISQENNTILRFKFSAKNVYLVMGSTSSLKVQVKLNGQVVNQYTKGMDVDDQGFVTVDGSKLYTLINLPSFETNQLLELVLPKSVKLNAFTFGS
ncbi:MAG: cytochrome c biogenesis protein DipZ [Candidatus Dojkabacteria bacterium]